MSRTRTGVNASQESYHYYAGSNRLQSVVGDHAELIEYDADGNMTQRTPGASNPVPAISDPSEYVYNSSGQRAVKDGVADVIYHYDLSGQLIAETDGAGVMLKAYVWLHGQPLAMIDGGGAVYYYHNDHLGTPQRMTDAGAEVVWAGDYLPFGGVDVTVGAVENHLRFAGQYYDAETGLHYNYFRYYDTKLGRYLRADPEGLNGGINLYAFVQNNPVNYIDPYGLKVETCSRWVGALGGSPTGHNNPTRHEYIKINGRYVGFFPKKTGKLWIEGDVVWGGEEGKNCISVCDDDNFDQYVIDAAKWEPDYVLFAWDRSIFHALGARNCQTWLDDVIEKAKKEYLDKEQCPECFQ